MCIFRANDVYFQCIQFVKFQHVNNSGRTYYADRGIVDLSMFGQDVPPSSDENGKRGTKLMILIDDKSMLTILSVVIRWNIL